MNIAHRGTGAAAQRARARVNVHSEPGVIDLTSDSEADDGFVELAAQPVRPQLGHNQPQLLDTPSPEPQIRLGIPAAAHVGPSVVNPPSPMRNDDYGMGDAVMGDYLFDDEFDDEMIARAMEREFQQQPQGEGEIPGLYRQEIQPPAEPTAVETRSQCLDNVAILFPGICSNYVSGLYDTVSKSSDRLIASVLDKTEKGIPYPKEKDQAKVLKRKREVDEEEEAARKYGALDRVIPSTGGNSGIRGYIRGILAQEFPETPMIFIDASLSQSGYRLFSAYRVLEEAQRTFDPRRPPYNKIKRQRHVLDTYNEQNIQEFVVANNADPARVDVLQELLAARRIRKKAGQKRLEERQAELMEEENTRKAEAEGTMSECGCCYGDYPLNRMVHCDSDEMHWFCRGCALRNAETEVGNSKYELKCMSMDGCTSGFSMEQRSQFLDKQTVIALERNHTEANLRLAGIENLASCPFCPYAAEYPPVKENREFRCEAPDCEKVSCRLCKLESHIPKSCEEHAKENGLSIRRQIEEAMSAAMIRKCNKCSTPFVKEEGCNKMTCTRPGCLNVQCYVCSKSCGYDHFDDRTRGGKPGNCPLFDSVDQRHDQEVKEAERIALEKVRAEHPEYTEEDLKVKMSENVLKDDERRKANDPRVRLEALRAAQGAAGDGLPHYFDMFPHPHRQFMRRPAPPPPQAGVAPPIPVDGGQAFFGRPYGGGYPGAFAEVFDDDDIFNNIWDDLPYPAAPALPGGVVGAGVNPWALPRRFVAQPAQPPNKQPVAPPVAPVIPELQNLRNALARQERIAALGLREQVVAGPGPGAPEAGLAGRRRGIAELERIIAQREQVANPPPIDRREHQRNLEQRIAHARAEEARVRRLFEMGAIPARGGVRPVIPPQLPPAGRHRPNVEPGEFQVDLQRELDAIDAHSQAINAAFGAQIAEQAAQRPQIAPNPILNLENASGAHHPYHIHDRVRRFEDDDMRRARQQQILDHAERRLHRRAEVTRLRREQEHDEAAVARGLRRLGEVAGVAGAAEARQRARLARREEDRNMR